MLPEITASDLAGKMKTADDFILLDVREPFELDLARIEDRRLQTAPVSRLAQQGPQALPDPAQAQDATIYVLCHHGNRSAQVTAWLAQRGWKNVFNVRGGIDEYARTVDPSVGSY